MAGGGARARARAGAQPLGPRPCPAASAPRGADAGRAAEGSEVGFAGAAAAARPWPDWDRGLSPSRARTSLVVRGARPRGPWPTAGVRWRRCRCPPRCGRAWRSWSWSCRKVSGPALGPHRDPRPRPGPRLALNSDPETPALPSPQTLGPLPFPRLGPRDPRLQPGSRPAFTPHPGTPAVSSPRNPRPPPGPHLGLRDPRLPAGIPPGPHLGPRDPGLHPALPSPPLPPPNSPRPVPGPLPSPDSCTPALPSPWDPRPGFESLPALTRVPETPALPSPRSLGPQAPVRIPPNPHHGPREPLPALAPGPQTPACIPPGPHAPALIRRSDPHSFAPAFWFQASHRARLCAQFGLKHVSLDGNDRFLVQAVGGVCLRLRLQVWASWGWLYWGSCCWPGVWTCDPNSSLCASFLPVERVITAPASRDCSS